MLKWVFYLVHAACLLVFYTGVSPAAAAAAVILYGVRMFAITAGYHRLFSHASYKTNRFFQFAIAWIGASAGQKGPLWWASHHRNHHRYSDTEKDIHSPLNGGLWWSHAGWVVTDRYDHTDWNAVPDLARFQELVWLNRYHVVAPTALACAMYGLGAALKRYAPGLGTNGLQMLVVGFLISTVALYHATFTINSLAHLFGTRRFETGDGSRNNLWLALLTMGEGWHNNHHRNPGSERQGIYWWEVDMTHYALKALSWTGLVWSLNRPHPDAYREGGASSGPSPRRAGTLAAVALALFAAGDVAGTGS